MSETNNNSQSVSGDTYTIPVTNVEIKQKQQEDFSKRAEQIIRPMLEKQRAEGIRIGLLAASKAVMEHLNDTSKPLLKRIELVKKFCNVATKDENAFLNKGINDNLVNPAENSTEVAENAEKSDENLENEEVSENNSTEE